MAEGRVRLKNIASVEADSKKSENILSFKEDHMMNIIPQFVPNVPQGVDVLQRAKWREITITLDSESDVFDKYWFVAAVNVLIDTTVVAIFDVADGAGSTETWTYEINEGWVMRKEFGRIEDGARRNTTEYVLLLYGTKLIT